MEAAAPSHSHLCCGCSSTALHSDEEQAASTRSDSLKSCYRWAEKTTHLHHVGQSRDLHTSFYAFQTVILSAYINTRLRENGWPEIISTRMTKKIQRVSTAEVRQINRTVKKNTAVCFSAMLQRFLSNCEHHFSFFLCPGPETGVQPDSGCFSLWGKKCRIRTNPALPTTPTPHAPESSSNANLMVSFPQNHQLDESSVSNAIARSSAAELACSDPPTLLLPTAFTLVTLLKHFQLL